MLLNTKRVKCSIRTISCCIAVCFATTGITSTASASIYNFFETGTGDLLAVLDLSTLPASQEDINSLFFTVKGNDIFGLGVGEYTFRNPSTIFPVQDDLSGGLGTGNSISTKTWIVDRIDPELVFIMIVGNPRNTDSITIELNQITQAVATGNWSTAVPEPTALIVWSMLLGATALGYGRRRKSHCLGFDEAH